MRHFAIDQLALARDITKEFDDDCKWKWNVGKGAVFASAPVDKTRAKARLSDIGGVVSDIQYLGVEYTVDVVRRREERYGSSKRNDWRKCTRGWQGSGNVAKPAPSGEGWSINW